MRYLPLLFLAAGTLHVEVIDTRGKKPSGVSVEAGDTDATGWRRVRIVKGKPGLDIIWPYDAMVTVADGPSPVPVIVGDAKQLNDPHVAAAALLRNENCNGAAGDDAFAKGVALLCGNHPADAVAPLGLALKERERQLTRIPSEIYPVAILYGRALLGAGKFDDAAVAFLKALRQRPGDEVARRYRSEALIKAGKPEAAQ